MWVTLVVMLMVIVTMVTVREVVHRAIWYEFQHLFEEEAAGVATRIREEYKAAVAALLRRNETATMSIGIGSKRCDDPTHADQLVAVADAALYHAKAAGRNRIVISNAPAATDAVTVTAAKDVASV